MNAHAPQVTMTLDEDADLKNPKIFKEYREQLRTKLMADQLLGNGGENELAATFSGSGDSGDWDDHFDDHLLKHLFDHLRETHVTWDWWNNDGGGGTVSWDLAKDEITIEGYWNEITATSGPTTEIGPDGVIDVLDPDTNETLGEEAA